MAIEMNEVKTNKNKIQQQKTQETQKKKYGENRKTKEQQILIISFLIINGCLLFISRIVATATNENVKFKISIWRSFSFAKEMKRLL